MSIRVFKECASFFVRAMLLPALLNAIYDTPYSYLFQSIYTMVLGDIWRWGLNTVWCNWFIAGYGVMLYHVIEYMVDLWICDVKVFVNTTSIITLKSVKTFKIRSISSKRMWIACTGIIYIQRSDFSMEQYNIHEQKWVVRQNK